MADDLGTGDVGAYGGTMIRTPHIDRLAAEGRKYTQAYSASTFCRPARASLMTGLHTGHTRIRENPGADTIHLQPSDVTVSELLKCHGYATGMFGKWGLGQSGTSGEPNLHGFDDWFGYLDQTHAHNYYPEFLWRNGQRVEIPENADGKKGVYSHDLFANEVVRFIRERAGAPFFLYVPLTLPHSNVALGSETGNGMEVPDDTPYSAEPWPQVERNYAAMVTRLDDTIGTIMAELAAAGIDENTLIFFTSDNGPSDVHDHSVDFFGSTSGRRGGKGALYEGGIRVPLIARWPGGIPAGTTSDYPWYFPDLLPTLLEVIGAAAVPGVDGLSNASELLGGEAPTRGAMYWELPDGDYIIQAVRKDDWKCIRYSTEVRDWLGLGPGDLQERISLFNLATDPGEQHDVAGQFPQVLDEMLAEMARSHVDTVDLPNA